VLLWDVVIVAMLLHKRAGTVGHVEEVEYLVLWDC